jgi:hypothetical protein
MLISEQASLREKKECFASIGWFGQVGDALFEDIVTPRFLAR